MGMELSETEVDALIKNLDTDGDGEIDYELVKTNIITISMYVHIKI